MPRRFPALKTTGQATTNLVSPPARSALRMGMFGCGFVTDSLRGYPLSAFLICLIAYTTAQMDLARFGYAVPEISAEFDLTLIEVVCSSCWDG